MWANTRQVAGRCPCGAQHAACGPPSTSVPFDQPTEEAAVGGPLQKYRVTTGHGVTTVMKLNAADAERLGGVPLDSPPAATAPAPVQGDSEEAAPAGLPAKRRAAAPNKARASARNKGGGGDG